MGIAMVTQQPGKLGDPFGSRQIIEISVSSSH